MGAERAPAGAILEVDALQLGPIGTNCYLVRESGSSRAFVVDPGDQHHRILELARDRGVSIEAVLITHCHWDHIGGVAGLVEATGAPVWMSSVESPVLEAPDTFPVMGPRPTPPAAVDHKLDGGERIEVAGIALDVLHTPGHSPGHLTFVADRTKQDGGERAESPPVAFVGDVIFQGSVGRTDLPFADGPTLGESLRMLIHRLRPETILLSGHGAITTMRAERASNPFLRGL